MTKKAQTKRKQQEQQIVNRYSELTDDQLKAAINEDDQEISVLEAKQDKRLIAAGEKLIALKARTKHGQWLPTLKTLRDGKGIPERTAQRWIGYAKDPAKLEKDREAWRNTPGLADLDSDKDTFEDDWESFKRKAREQEKNGTYGFKTDNPNSGSYGGKPAEELVTQELRKIKNAAKRLQEMSEYAEHIHLDDQALDLLNQAEAVVTAGIQQFKAQCLPKPITPDNIQLEVLH
jgi:hypothetical protein